MSISSDSFHLTPEQFARLTNLAREMGRPLPDVLDDVLAAYHPGQSADRPIDGETSYDAADDAEWAEIEQMEPKGENLIKLVRRFPAPKDWRAE